MTIEFHCPSCNKLLKTPDDKAGVRANCPGCGETVTVPNAMEEAALADESPVDSADDAAGTPPAVVDDTKDCPMCGKTIKKAAIRCRYCGETLKARPASGAWTPTRIEPGPVLNHAWEVYKQNLGLLIASTVIVGAISFGFNLAVSMVQQVIIMALGAAGPGGGNQNEILAITAGMSVFGGLANFAVQQFMQAGLTVFLLRVARGGTPEISDLFNGRPYFWRFFWGGMLVSLLIGFGLVLLIVPGIIAALMFWATYNVIVDRDLGVIDSMKAAHEAMAGNYMTILVLALAAFGINLLGALACCVGLLFSAPLSGLLMVIAYCGMTGQLTFEEQPAAG